jgi:hypothetical protein
MFRWKRGIYKDNLTPPVEHYSKILFDYEDQERFTNMFSIVGMSDELSLKSKTPEIIDII